jgi:hypothetical protein
MNDTGCLAAVEDDSDALDQSASTGARCSQAGRDRAHMGPASSLLID